MIREDICLLMPTIPLPGVGAVCSDYQRILSLLVVCVPEYPLPTDHQAVCFLRGNFLVSLIIFFPNTTHWGVCLLILPQDIFPNSGLLSRIPEYNFTRHVVCFSDFQGKSVALLKARNTLLLLTKDLVYSEFLSIFSLLLVCFQEYPNTTLLKFS